MRQFTTPLSQVSSLSRRTERSILAIALPTLLEELACEQQPPETNGASNVSPGSTSAGNEHSSNNISRSIASQNNVSRSHAPCSMASRKHVPRAIVLAEDRSTGLEPKARIDAVNAAAHRLGVSTRQTIAQAMAMAEQLVLHTVPPASVSRALQQVAEAALGFGSPVAFQAPDTVWVDISGTHHLFGGPRALAQLLAAHVRTLGHSANVAVASGPWLARAFAQHADFDETGVFLAEPAQEARQVGLLPIAALPISSEAVAWFSRLGLLSLDELRRLPRPALAARLGPDAERVLELIFGHDAGVLDAYHPEELPFEQQSWDTPLENVEPLLFVLKGLCARLASRLEGRGQAARELLISIQYDRSIAALRHREREAAAVSCAPPSSQALQECGAGEMPSLIAELRLQLGSPLVHAEELERIARARLQRETLLAPACGLRLQVTALTEARHWQLGLNADVGLGQLTDDPSLMTVLINELSADVGDAAVGMLEAHESHVPEKSSGFIPLQSLTRDIGAPPRRFDRQPSARRGPGRARPHESSASPTRAGRLPTRLIAPIELDAPLEKNELVVIEQRAFIIGSIQFEERLESVEWWASRPISRDYYRIWLAALSSPLHPSQPGRGARTAWPDAAWSDAMNSSSMPGSSGARRASEGLEVLVYLNRDDGKKYVQAIYD